MTENKFDLKLKLQLEELFVKKDDVDLSKSNVVAALANAASYMATVSEKYDKSVVADQVLDLFEKKDDEETLQMIDMGPQFVKGIIGYSIEFNDFHSAYHAYRAEKNSYDTVFSKLVYRDELQKQNALTKAK